MIKLSRHRTREAVHVNFRGSIRQKWSLELLQQELAIKQGNISTHDLQEGRWKVVKPQLWIETVDKCAYCEATTRQVAHGDVEHYRPKSVYWWLAYNYDNYLVSCLICNQVFKRDAFPVKGKRIRGPRISASTSPQRLLQLATDCAPDPLSDDEGMPLNTFLQLHLTERPLLLNPYYDDPALYFAWEEDKILGQVLLIPKNDQARHFVKAAEDYYGLNRKELAELRFFFFEIYETFRLTLEDSGISEQTRHRTMVAIEKMKHARAPFAGMIRYFDSNRQAAI